MHCFVPRSLPVPDPFEPVQKGKWGFYGVISRHFSGFLFGFCFLGPDEFLFISLFSACLLRLLNLVSVCDLLPLVSLLIRQTQGYLRRGEQCKKYTLAFKLSVDN